MAGGGAEFSQCFRTRAPFSPNSLHFTKQAPPLFSVSQSKEPLLEGPLCAVASVRVTAVILTAVRGCATGIVLFMVASHIERKTGRCNHFPVYVRVVLVPSPPSIVSRTFYHHKWELTP